MIGALFRRIRARRARRQIRWALGYISARYGPEHQAARKAALENWEAWKAMTGCNQGSSTSITVNGTEPWLVRAAAGLTSRWAWHGGR